jgi:2-hydroxy-3-keto-5-methylthiopentenyl-1-phosphate phosphatase
MKNIIYLIPLLIITSCANSPSSKPSVLYAAPLSIGVLYYSGDSTTDAEQSKKAMEIIAKHCYVNYEVISKKEKDGWTTIDAQCK